MTTTFDLAVVGAGFVGLAHAHAAARLGKRVVVIDRDAQANGASIRGYGICLITGQPRGITWKRARRSAEILRGIARDAGLAAEARGLMTVALRPEGMGLCESFHATEMGDGCLLLSPEATRKRLPVLAAPGLCGALWSPHELRYDARGFIAALARWLAETQRVTFMRETHVRSVFPSRLDTSAGPVRAEAVVVCPGEDLRTLFAHRAATYRLTRCRVRMMRLSPGSRFRLAPTVQSDLGLLASPGFAELPEARALAIRLQSEKQEGGPTNLRLVVTQSADRSLIVGDSRTIAPTPDPFMPAAPENHLLSEFDRLFALPERTVIERWTGIHVAADRPLIVERPAERVRLVMPTGAFGASAALVAAEEVVAELFGAAVANAAG